MIAAPCVVTTGCPAQDPSFESTPNIRDRALSLPALHALLCVVAPSNRGKIPGCLLALRLRAECITRRRAQVAEDQRWRGGQRKDVTYLAVVEWDGFSDQHCIIAPTEHTCSSIQLDENVWDEMRIWRKGLVAMWREMDEDCLFVEMSRNLTAGPHHVIECIPVPVEVGDTAPIYFKILVLRDQAHPAEAVLHAARKREFRVLTVQWNSGAPLAEPSSDVNEVEPAFNNSEEVLALLDGGLPTGVRLHDSTDRLLETNLERVATSHGALNGDVGSWMELY
ncbi:unnamed protein product [Heligmosomoides polygyrus]|uniref:CwfJ_C_1 domain-containing protein n=1 Tax=Heligmosomoides polygyrus TaxID=6339 RepID=A0A183GAF1_HELPZ|nr:unnamed protein product [Heligmosomoides polygyrus]